MINFRSGIVLVCLTCCVCLVKEALDLEEVSFVCLLLLTKKTINEIWSCGPLLISIGSGCKTLICTEEEKTFE